MWQHIFEKHADPKTTWQPCEICI